MTDLKKTQDVTKKLCSTQSP